MSANRPFRQESFNSFDEIWAGISESNSRVVGNLTAFGGSSFRLPCSLFVGSKAAQTLADTLADGSKASQSEQRLVLDGTRAAYYPHELYLTSEFSTRKREAFAMFERDDQPGAQMEQVPGGFAADSAGMLYFVSGYMETQGKAGGPLLWVVGPTAGGFGTRVYRGDTAKALFDQAASGEAPIRPKATAEDLVSDAGGKALVWDAEWKAISWVENFGHIAQAVEMTGQHGEGDAPPRMMTEDDQFRLIADVYGKEPAGELVRRVAWGDLPPEHVQAANNSLAQVLKGKGTAELRSYAENALRLSQVLAPEPSRIQWSNPFATEREFKNALRVADSLLAQRVLAPYLSELGEVISSIYAGVAKCATAGGPLYDIARVNRDSLWERVQGLRQAERWYKKIGPSSQQRWNHLRTLLDPKYDGKYTSALSRFLIEGP